MPISGNIGFVVVDSVFFVFTGCAPQLIAKGIIALLYSRCQGSPHTAPSVSARNPYSRISRINHMRPVVWNGVWAGVFCCVVSKKIDQTGDSSVQLGEDT
jgi:hypothetical protein